jgi:ribonucleotide reductase alpha subunit
MSNGTKVKKRDGRIEYLDLDKMHLMVEEACKGLAGVSASQVEMTSGIQFYDGITTSEIQEILIRSASDLIDLDHPNYQYVAARLLLFSVRKQLYGKMKELPDLEQHIINCTSIDVYDKEIFTKYSKEEIAKANSYIDHDRDYLFTYAGLRQVVDKYLVQDRSGGGVYETPQFMYMMIALTIFAEYPKETRMSYVKRYYDAISKHKINIPTPIMAGVRTPLRQFASCVLVDVDDTRHSIIHSNTAIFEYVCQRAGIGINAGRIRGINSKIRGGEVQHTGVIPFLKMFEATVRSCTQNGIRGGSATVHFPIWHQEIEDILVLKNNKGTEDNRVRKLDYSIQISKLFYERFIEDGEITLFSPHNVPGLYDSFGTDRFDDLYISYEKNSSIPKKTVKAQELILSLLKERAETGRIYIMNIDHCNSHSSFKDKIEMSNLCVSGDTKIKTRVVTYIDNGDGANEVRYGSVNETTMIGLEQFIKAGLLFNWQRVEVLSYNFQSNQEEWAPITAFAQTSPKAKVMKIEFRGPVSGPRSIVITPEHKIYIENRGYVMAKDLTKTDRVKFRGGVEVYCVGTLGMYSKIEYLEEEIPVYDITVEGTHNFFANDILVHNCQEITLPTYPLQHIDDETGEIALCILSAINVGKVKSDEELEELCELSVRGLEELIDYQNYPVKAAEIATRARRSLGIGFIGLAHYLAKLGFKYDSQEAWDAVHGLSESFQYYLLKASNQLAKEKGHCEYFGRTKYADGILPIDTYKKDVDQITSIPLEHDWESLRASILEHGLRHSTLSAQMPSESSSVVSNATNGIEPPRGFLSIKKSKKGPLKQIVPQYHTLKNNYTLLWDMPSNTGYIHIVAVMQKFLDQAISGNWSYNPENYADNEVPVSVMAQDMLTCFKFGHKTAYYQNTYDIKTDEVIEETKKSLESLLNDIMSSEEDDCESCKI